MSRERCQADGWTPDDSEVICDLDDGHDGNHVDTNEGWEWA